MEASEVKFLLMIICQDVTKLSVLFRLHESQCCRAKFQWVTKFIVGLFLQFFFFFQFGIWHAGEVDVFLDWKHLLAWQIGVELDMSYIRITINERHTAYLGKHQWGQTMGLSVTEQCITSTSQITRKLCWAVVGCNNHICVWISKTARYYNILVGKLC